MHCVSVLGEFSHWVSIIFLWRMCSRSPSFCSFLPPCIHSFIHQFFFFVFFGRPRHMEFPGKGSDLSHSCNLCCRCGKDGSLNPLCWESNLRSGTAKTLPILLHHVGNSCQIFFECLLYIRHYSRGWRARTEKNSWHPCLGGASFPVWVQLSKAW